MSLTIAEREIASKQFLERFLAEHDWKRGGLIKPPSQELINEAESLLSNYWNIGESR